jgi:hypothetical protein
MVRFIFICGALLVVFAGVALGEGNYQRTKDSKIIVWNDEPKSGDAATWFGDRDKEGYATGVGTLTWYTAKGTVYARYHGNMVRGKFDGAVNAHSKGRTGHAVFIDGKRTGDWTAGPAPSRSEITAGRVRVAAATEPDWRLTAKASASKSPNFESVREQPPQRATTEAPVKTPLPEKRDVAKEKSVQHPREDSPAEGPVAESKSPRSIATPTSAVATQDKSHTSKVSGQKPDIIAPKTVSTNKSQAAPDGSKPEVTDFLGPPSALRTDPVVEAPSTGAEPETASSPSASAQLSPQEALALADAEARAQGYDLNAYQRPKADYSVVKGKWSLVYDLKHADAAAESAQHFGITVDDQTKKAELKQ